MTPFQNLAIRRFDQPIEVAAMHKALIMIKAAAGKEYPLLIGVDSFTRDQKLVTTNPSDPDFVLARFQKATREQAETAIALAAETFPAWSQTSVEERADYLIKAAAALRERRDLAVATMVLEAGKNWLEADADFAEAVDFLEYYAREALRYGGQQPVVPLAGEQPEMFYIPLGVGAIIPPWNFPLAILTGMASAAIVTGNTIVLKPASETPLTGHIFVEAMQAAGLPAGVLNYLPGSGGEIGDFIVDHPKVRFISFTGSMEIGLRINERAAKAQPGQIWIKRVAAEMGGKDAIVVDADADLEDVASGAVAAAFGYQGQKCSACSRLIAHQDIHDDLLKRIVEKTEALTVGPPDDPANFMGPVINQSALEKTLAYIEIGKQEGQLLTGGLRTGESGYFVTPAVIAGISSGDRLAQEEIFGPVLAVLKATDFDEALTMANDSIYGLTGAVYSGSEAHLQQARQQFHVGNLYLNRKCTGALVGVHPFGGFNMSGTNSKAGGPDYLRQFLQSKSVSRKIQVRPADS
ncbi:MAG: L-glutamate gamma-semialdehyde dehydrogenase [Candidatus Marinimicrobia bacterium]|nr:L-glutamate gamma-semialdehyde dehydrogenase [Candidatus Neomarinimicrobiota bacterium]